MKPQIPSLLGLSLAPLIHACGNHDNTLSPSEFDHQVNHLRTRDVSHPINTEIKNVRVFDGFEFTAPKSIFLSGSHIIDPSSKPHSSSNTSESGPFKDHISSSDDDNIVIVDGSNKFLIPGLMESHVHITTPTGLSNITSYGVTTALNMACHNYTQCATLRSLPGLATFLSAGQPAIGPGSPHSKTFDIPPDQLVYPDSDPARVVGNVASNGSDWMKITVEQNGPDEAMQEALVQQAHAYGLPAMSHAADVKSYAQAAKSGTDGIQHIPADGPISNSTLATIIANGQFVTPTMEVWRISYANPELVDILNPGSANSSYAAIRSNVNLLRKAGVPIIAGTDSVGAFQGYTLPFGLTLHCELENLVDAGFEPVDALRAATSLPAKLHHLHDRGVIATGKRADVMLLNSNPLEDISNTQDIDRIWVGGVEYKDVASRSLTCSDLLHQSKSA